MGKARDQPSLIWGPDKQSSFKSCAAEIEPVDHSFISHDVQPGPVVRSEGDHVLRGMIEQEADFLEFSVFLGQAKDAGVLVVSKNIDAIERGGGIRPIDESAG